MGVSLAQWRASIGLHNRNHRRTQGFDNSLLPLFLFFLVLLQFTGIITAAFVNLLLLAGDVEENPGPPKTSALGRKSAGSKRNKNYLANESNCQTQIRQEKDKLRHQD